MTWLTWFVWFIIVAFACVLFQLVRIADYITAPKETPKSSGDTKSGTAATPNVATTGGGGSDSLAQMHLMKRHAKPRS
jgi:hypothetical protein